MVSGAAQQGPLSYKEIERAQLVRPILQLFGVGDGELRQEQAEGIGTDTARLLGCAGYFRMAQQNGKQQLFMGRS